MVDRIREHEICVQYPSARMDVDYITKLREWYDGALVEERARILAQEVLKWGYHKGNISEAAVNDTSKRCKIHFFLSNHNYTKKLNNNILKIVKM